MFKPLIIWFLFTSRCADFSQKVNGYHLNGEEYEGSVIVLHRVARLFQSASFGTATWNRNQPVPETWPFPMVTYNRIAATKIALREMLHYLTTVRGLPVIDAYPLMSIAVDLSITQLVDGRKGVHAMLPKAIFVVQ